MAKVKTRYGRLYIEPSSELASGEMVEPLGQPVDLLLLLGSDEGHIDRAAAAIFPFESFMRRPHFVPTPGRPDPWAAQRRRTYNRWRSSGVPRVFLRAAKRAAEGRFTPEIGVYLAEVQFASPDESIEINDYLPLAAWSLDQAMRSGKFHVDDCKHCGQPFLATAHANYCLRPAPGDALVNTLLAPLMGSVTSLPTCQDVGKVKDYRERKRATRREEKGDTSGKR